MPSMRAAMRCTAPMNAPRPPPIIPKRSLRFSMRVSLLLAREGGVERRATRGEIQATHESNSLGGTVHAIHAGVLPLDGQRAAIADVVERGDHVLELHVAPPKGAEVPVEIG